MCLLETCLFSLLYIIKYVSYMYMDRFEGFVGMTIIPLLCRITLVMVGWFVFVQGNPHLTAIKILPEVPLQSY